MRRTLLLSGVVVSLLVSACGGGGGSGSSSAYCNKLRDVQKEAQRTTSTSAANTAALKAAFEKAFDRIAKTAPAELKDDYTVLREYYNLYIAALTDPKADRTRLTALTSKFSAASKNITDYNKNVCKIETTTSTPRATVATTAAPTTKPTTVTTAKR